MMFLDTSILLESLNNTNLKFYHLIPKNANLSNGVCTLQYFYDNQMYDEFDRFSEKYRYRLVYAWKYYPNRDPYSLTREEIIKGLNKFRKSKYGASTVYLFRFPPYKELGKHMEDILKNKLILELNIDNKALQKYIYKINWGFRDSNSDNERLKRSYYEDVTKDEYFENYNDNDKMNFAKLNHIGIECIEGFIPIKFFKIYMR